MFAAAFDNVTRFQYEYENELSKKQIISLVRTTNFSSSKAEFHDKKLCEVDDLRLNDVKVESPSYVDEVAQIPRMRDWRCKIFTLFMQN